MKKNERSPGQRNLDYDLFLKTMIINDMKIHVILFQDFLGETNPYVFFDINVN